MNKILNIAVGATLLLTLGATAANADVKKGQKLFTKKLKGACGITGAAMAGKHTQGEWDDVQSAGKMADEIKTICPKVKDKAVKEK